MPERLCLTDPDYLVFEALDRHGPLPIHYLYEFQKALRPSYRHFQYRLRDLYHGDKEGGYLTRPPAQFAAYDARYQHLVYDLSERGKQSIAERGTLSPWSARRYDPFVHQLMTACVTASMELLAPTFNLRFISKDEILSRPTCPNETRNRGNPLAIEIGARRLIPDGVFGLQYGDQGFRFFAFEADRNTESIVNRKGDATTFTKKNLDYHAVLGQRLYKTQWGLPNLSVLTVTTNDRHMKNLLGCIRTLEEEALSDRFLFKAEPCFGSNWRVPTTLLTHLMTEPWACVRGEKVVARP